VELRDRFPDLLGSILQHLACKTTAVYPGEGSEAANPCNYSLLNTVETVVPLALDSEPQRPIVLAVKRQVT
jgi:hypothetical protein